MYKILFICVDYHGWVETKKFCESLAAQNGFGSEFSVRCVVVDNSEDADVSKKLADGISRWKWVVHCPVGKNIGYFAGLNFGLKSVTLAEWDFVIISNNDLCLDVDFCRVLVNEKYANNVFAICPDVVTSDGYHQNPHLSRRIGIFRRLKYDLYYSHYFVAVILTALLRLLRPKRRNSNQVKESREIHMGIGAIYVLTRGFFKNFEKLSYPFFLYGEEAFIADQIHSARGILWFDPKLLVLHAESAATGKIPRRAVYEFSREGYSSYRGLL